MLEVSWNLNNGFFFGILGRLRGLRGWVLKRLGRKYLIMLKSCLFYDSYQDFALFFFEEAAEEAG